MVRYLVRRAASAAVLLLVISALIFFLMRLTPGDPVALMTGPLASEEYRERIRSEFALDQPVPVQYFAYMKNALRGDLGRSIYFRQSVTDLVRDSLWPSILLGGSGLLIAYLIAVPSGVVAAVRHNSAVDRTIRGATLLGLAIPNYWLGMMLIIIFGVNLGWVPLSGYGTWKHLLLPALAVGVEATAVATRLIRSSMLEILRADFVRTFRARGLNERRILYKHCLRNALLPTISFLGLRLGWILSAQVVIEVVFAWPGVGRLMVDAIAARDFPLVQALAILFAGIVVLGSFLADVLYSLADPRIRR